ncbi:MAG: hypothetical protein PHV74_15605, partial [Dehalococcoidia bacterium]|nr:hypothetical protein [Dehalococcoidia bacterium]
MMVVKTSLRGSMFAVFYRQEDFESAIKDDKPLAEALKEILRSSPSLSSLFLTGTRLPNPFKTKQVSSADVLYEGHLHPTYFKFQKLDYGKELKHKTPRNMKCRIIFETDVVNDYFVRSDNHGEFVVQMTDGLGVKECKDYGLTLRDGRAVLSLTLPDDSVIGQELNYEARVSDPTLVKPFINRFTVMVAPEQDTVRTKPKKAFPPLEDDGHKRETSTRLSIPSIKEIKESQWEKYG